MKQTIQILTTILITFLLPLFTSLLLDWPWIANAWPRYGLVILLMLVEITTGVFIFKEVALGKQGENVNNQN